MEVGHEVTAAEALQVIMNEFEALRDEVNQRATHCRTLIDINVLASGTIRGFVFENPQRVPLLLLIPVLSPVLGLLWLDHSYAIRTMGDYINDELKPAVMMAASVDTELLRWETYVDERERDTSCCGSSHSGSQSSPCLVPSHRLADTPAP
jgi:hypothetical protein